MNSFFKGMTVGLIAGGVSTFLFIKDEYGDQLMKNVWTLNKNKDYLMNEGTQLSEETIKNVKLDIHKYKRNISPIINRLNRKLESLNNDLR